MDNKKAVLRTAQRAEGDARHRLNMTWRQVLLYVQGSEGHRNCEMSWQERLVLCGRALGYDVMISHAEGGGDVSLIREGIESHTFTGDQALNGVYEFLFGNLAFNASYYPYEELAWSPEELNALCYGEKIFRELYDEEPRYFT